MMVCNSFHVNDNNEEWFDLFMEVVDNGFYSVCPIKDDWYFDCEEFQVLLRDGSATFIECDDDEACEYTLVSVNIMFLRDVYKVN